MIIPKRNIFICVLTFFSAIFLSSCGGGGGESGSSTATSQATPPASVNAQATPPVPIAKVASKVITFSSSAAAAVRAGVTEILSPVGAAKPGFAVDIPDPTVASAAPILAVNAQGQILMATSASGSGELSSDSTAMALVYWIAGPDPLGATLPQLETQARASGSFGRLVAAVALAQEQATPLTSNAGVLNELFAVLRETTTALTATTAAAASKSSLSKRIASPSIPADDFEAIMGSFGPVPMRLLVSDVNLSSAIRVKNSTPLFWAVRTEKQAGSPLAVLSPNALVSDSYGIIPGATIASSILSNVPIVELFPVVPTIDLQDLPAEGFNIRIAQNKKSMEKNWESVFYQSIKSFMKISLSSSASDADKCYLSIAIFTVNSVGDTLSSVKPTISNLSSMLKRSLSDSTKMFASCAPELFGPAVQAKEVFKRYASIYFPEVTALYSGYAALGEANNALTVVAQILAMDKYHSDTPKLYGICERLGPLKNGTISPCLTSIKFKPFIDLVTGQRITNPSFLVGSSVLFDINGYIDDELALLPASVMINNLSSSSIIVDLENRLLKSTKLGAVSLQLVDAATEVKDALSGNVVINGTLKSGKDTISVGESTTLRLVDNNGNTVFTNGANLAWSASPSDAISFSGGSGGFINNVKGLKASSTPVIITALLDNLKVAEASVTVGVGGYWQLTVNPPTACTRTPKGEQWAWNHPCSQFVGPMATNSLEILFADENPSVVFVGYLAGGSRIDGGNLKRVFPLAWQSKDNAFSYSVSNSFFQDVISLEDTINVRNNPPPTISGSGTTTVMLTVTSRTASGIAGTYLTSGTSGYFSLDRVYDAYWNTISTTSNGTWSAGLINGKLPVPEMNGYDFCQFNNAAAYQMDPTNKQLRNPRFSPGWGVFTPSACVYQPR